MAGQGASVLVVDDEDFIRGFVKRTLESCGYDVHAAADGPSALAYVDRGMRFDLVIADVNMPGMRGDELARRLRSRCPDLKVLFHTGYVEALFSEHPHMWEGQAFLEKPVTISELREAVSLLLYGSTQQPGPKPAWFRRILQASA